MSISRKIILGYLSVIAVMAFLTLFVLHAGKTFLLTEANRNSLFIAEGMAKRVEQSVFLRTDDLRLTSRVKTVQSYLKKSNDYFAAMKGRAEFIRRMDKKWNSEDHENLSAAFMKEGLLSSEISENLRKIFIYYYEAHYGYSSFSEIFITNQYGCNIAQTGKTSDYYQADEIWWKEAKDDSVFYGEVEYDQSSKIFGMPVAVRIDDSEDKFIGVIKGFIPLMAIIRKAEIINKKYQSTKLMLLNQNGQLLYFTQPAKLFKDMTQKPFYPKLSGNKGFFVCNPDDSHQEKMFAYKKINLGKGEHDESWYLILINDQKEILGSSRSLEKKIWVTIGIAFLLAILIAHFIGRLISRPVIALNKAAREVAEGNFFKKITHQSTDEIGELAAAFNIMTEKLQLTLGYLTKSEEQFRTMFEQSPMGMAIAFPETLEEEVRINQTNPALQKMFGYTNEEIRQLGWNALTHVVEDKKPSSVQDSFIVEESGAYKFEKRYVRKDGTIIWGNLTVSAVFDEDGKSLYLISVIEDITERKKKDKELRKLWNVVEESPLSVVITDPQGNIEYVNPFFTQITGYSKLEAIGKNPRVLKSGEHPDSFYEKLWQTISSGQSWQGEFLNRKKDGSLYWEEAVISPLIDSMGIIINYVGLKNDITGRKIAEDANKKEQERKDFLLQLNSMTKSPVEALALNIVNSAVQMTKSLFGFCANILPEMGIFRVQAWSDGVWNECRMDDIAKAQDFLIKDLAFLAEVIRQKKPVMVNDYQTTPLAKHGVPEGHISIDRFLAVPVVQNDSVVAVLAVANAENEYSKQDVYQLEEFFQRAWQVVQHRIDEENVLAAKNEAERATAAKSDFLARMSHEIRTPMNAILGMAELLSETPLEPEQLGFLQTINTSGEVLLATINDILDFSKIEANRVELEQISFDIWTLAEDIVRVAAVRARGKKLELACRIAKELYPYRIGDPNRLKQVLLNLLGNAVKFTETGEVLLEILIKDESNPDRLQLRVQDTGIGISPEKQKIIFDSFSQADSTTTRRYGGSGLGLAISRRLVELMGGQIWTENNEGPGCTFIIEVPLPCTEQKPDAVEYQEPDLKNIKVMIIDDISVNRLIVNEHLSRWGADVFEANGGDSALDELARTIKSGDHYDLVLLDFNMPGMDGFSVAGQIQTMIKNPPPIVLLSSSDQQTNHQRDFSLGIVKRLNKPILRRELGQAILTVLGKTGLPDVPVVDYKEIPEIEASIPELQILLAEDIKANRDIIYKFLENTAVIISWAENGRHAVEQYEKDRHDLILMDIQMPEMDGIEATRVIRAWEEENAISPVPIIALTAHVFAEERRACLMAGCSDFLPKPVSRIDLLTAVLSAVAGEKKLTPEHKKQLSKTVEPEERFIAQIDLDLMDLIPDLISEIKDKIQIMEKGINSNDCETVYRLGHGLKGAAGNYGLKDLAAIFLAIEKAGKKADKKEIKDRIVELTNYLEHVDIIYKR